VHPDIDVNDIRPSDSAIYVAYYDGQFSSTQGGLEARM